ncbi:MAG: hypothetical protein IJZ20_06225, partial [Clostridia bacterium]|nr:hypothetical protein [Clostridia bacterium]
ERINHLYPQHRKVLTREYYDLYDVDEIEDKHILYTLDCGTDPDWTAWEVASWSKNTGGSFGVSNSIGQAITLTQKFAGEFDARDVTHIRVVMKSPTGSSIRFWYNGPETSNYQGYTWTSESDDVTTYVIDTSGFPMFQGKLNIVRIDPTEHPNAEFMVKSIEFLSLKDEKTLSKEVTIDDTKFDMSVSPYLTDEGVALLPFDPIGTVIDSRLGVFYLWNRDKNELTLSTKKNTIVFTVGSDIMLVDGKEKKLASPVESVDSLPAIPIKEFCDYAGYTFKLTDDKKIEIITPRKAQVDAEIAAREPGKWDFNTINDTEGWGSYTLSLDTVSGVLSGRSAGSEVNRHITNNGPLGIDLADYSGVEISIKYKYQADAPSSSTIYFTTEEDKKWGEDKTRYGSLNSTDSGDNFEVYTFDFSEHEKWNGTLRGLRFDAFRTSSGSFEIEYIRLIPKETEQ